MKMPPKGAKGLPPQHHSRKPGGLKKGDAHKLVKSSPHGDTGEVYPEIHAPETPDAQRAKDLDNAATGAGMNLDFPNTALQDRYQPISPFRMRALSGRKS